MTATATAKASDTERLKGALTRIFVEKGAWFAGEVRLPDGASVKIAGATGQIPEIDSDLELIGTWSEFRGERQFKFSDCRSTLPACKDGALRFLCTLPGLGQKRAEGLVEFLGADAVEQLLADPSPLRAIKGLGADAASRIHMTLIERAGSIETEQRLCALSFGPRTRQKIAEEFGDRLGWVLRNDPYQLCRVDRVSFHVVDNGVMRLGQFAEEAPERAAAAAIQALRDAANDGHTWLERDLLDVYLDRLKLARPIPANARERGVRLGRERGVLMQVDGDRGVALKAIAELEEEIAKRFAKLLAGGAEPVGSIENVEKEEWKRLAPKQRDAVAAAVKYPVSVMTGGPGTGKTTTLKAMLQAFGDHEVLVLAPTGRAARRASEVTQERAVTMHLFALTSRTDDPYNPDDDSDAPETTGPRILVIEEASMAAVDILAKVLRAAPRPDLRVVFVGDVDQLPSIGAGNVLHDMMASGVVPTTRLEQVMRQAEGSRIVTNAHRINAGEWPDNSQGENGDWYVFPGLEQRRSEQYKTAEGLAERIVPLVSRAAERWGYDVVHDIQVLCPMRKGPLGVNALNERLRAAFNPPGVAKAEIQHGRWASFRVGDKVLVTKNNYDLLVVNGDVGVVVDAWKAGKVEGLDGEEVARAAGVRVRFDDGRSAEFLGDDMDILTQGWAITIHKSQGSEYPCAVVCIHDSHYIMLRRSLLYTAVTRARERVILPSTDKAIGFAVRNAEERDRFTRLARLLAAEVGARGAS
ncbi:MAG: AAA family ATPase [Sumerlaeia bacterium]